MTSKFCEETQGHEVHILLIWQIREFTKDWMRMSILSKDYSVHYSTVAVIQLQSSKGWMEEKGGINNFTGKVSKQIFSKSNQVWLWVYAIMLLFSLIDIHSATPFEDLFDTLSGVVGISLASAICFL